MLIGECLADLPADMAKHGSEGFTKRSNMVQNSYQFGLSSAQEEFPHQRWCKQKAFRLAGAISLRSRGRPGDFEALKCHRGLLQSGG
jgi:hypothetical protein